MSGSLAPEALGTRAEDGIGLLYPDQEGNVPAWFSSSVLLLCAASLASVALAVRAAGGRRVLQWAALAVIFAGLSMEEAVAVHEVFAERLQSLLDTGGLLYNVWVIPAGLLVAVFALAYRGLLLELPAEIRRRFILAGVVYVGGALGVEMVGGLVYEARGEDLIYVLLATAEEFLEMAGAALLLFSLMLYTASAPHAVQERGGRKPATSDEPRATSKT